MGRFLVRSTLASRSLSQRSFTVQPAPLSSSAPAPKSVSSLTSGKAPGGLASAMDQKQGQARSHVPACEACVYLLLAGQHGRPLSSIQYKAGTFTSCVWECTWQRCIWQSLLTVIDVLIIKAKLYQA